MKDAAKAKELRKLLHRYATGKAKPKHKALGLCSTLKTGGFNIDQLGEKLQGWPEGSGYYAYTIYTQPDKYSDPSVEYSAIPDKWDARTPHGKARRRLCSWLVAELDSGRWEPEFLSVLTEQEQGLQDYLYRLSYDNTLPTESRISGLCYMLSDIIEIRDLIRIMLNWPECSGDKIYPIHTDSEAGPKGQYDNADDKWDSDTEYGLARRRLCGWLAEQIRLGYWKPVMLKKSNEN